MIDPLGQAALHITAVCTQAVVDMRHVIFYLHGSVLAGLLTLLTADTSDITLYHNGFTTFGAAAGYMSGCVVWNQGDQVLWAGGDTFAASFTFFFVYNGYTVDDMYGIERTGFGAVAKAKATVAGRALEPPFGT